MLKNIFGPDFVHGGLVRAGHFEEDHTAVCVRRGVTVMTAQNNVKLPVYVNEGRLLVDCLCGSGVAVDPDDKVACCFGCGLVYRARHLDFPKAKDLQDVDDEFTRRPARHRNWNPLFETPAHIVNETNAMIRAKGGRL